jgi:LemA protein
MIGIILFLIALAAFMLVGLVLIFNRLVHKRQMVKNGWADIDVQLKRRSDLIPRLVESVRGYAAHEKSLFEDVVAKRSAALAAGDNTAERGKTETALSQPVARLMAVAEAYPDLKASRNFLELQTELSDTETKIEMARRFFNGAVRELNTTVESFPANLVASLFGFRQRDFFEIETADRALPSVDFKGT